MKFAYSIFLVMILASCGVKNRQYENYGDIKAGPGGIVLSNIEEHRGGWERNECLICHNINLNVHLNAGFNVEEFNQRVRDNQGSKYCITCHGTNGTDTISY